MSTIHSNIDDHYGGVDICQRIFEALETAGKDLEALTAEDLTPFDQFHGGGIASTRDLAAFSGIRGGMAAAVLADRHERWQRNSAAESSASI